MNALDSLKEAAVYLSPAISESYSEILKFPLFEFAKVSNMVAKKIEKELKQLGK